MTAAPTVPPVRRVRWPKTFRLIPSRYPPIDLFERIADPADWETLAAIEGLTNDRLRHEIGQIAMVPVADRVAGPGASPIMAAFTHIGYPSRFTDGSYGVYYAADRFEAALAEVLHHRTAFFLRTAEPPTQFDLRTYVGRIAADLHDVRGGWPLVHDPRSYVHAQALARTLRGAGSHGVVYDAVRASGAANIAIFRPRALAAPAGRPHVVQGQHVRVAWDGRRMARYIIMGEPDWRAI